MICVPFQIENKVKPEMSDDCKSHFFIAKTDPNCWVYVVGFFVFKNRQK